MKRNIKKLGVFVIIAAIAMFVAVGTVLAFPVPFHHSIRGEYGSTTECTCMIAPFGFNPDLTPINNAGLVSIANRKAILTFEKDGTGSLTDGNGSQISLAFVGPNGPVPPTPSSYTFSGDFTYTVTGDGVTTITYENWSQTFTSGPNKGLTYQVMAPPAKGIITPDNKIITTYTDASDLGTISGPNLPPVSPNVSCTCISVLNKLP